MTAMVEAEGLWKSYGTTQAVRDVSFRIAKGEVVGFLGPNGAGKSTTMRLITGYLEPSAGDVKVAGMSVTEHPLETRARIGYLPESTPLYDDMMVIDYLVFMARMRGMEESAIRPRLKEVCARCGLLDVLGKDISQLSKGYRQRVGLAQAIVHDPDILILDEPTSGLDPNQILDIRELIKELGQEKTVILSTHIMQEVQATCSRVLIISDGKLVADDTPDALTERESGSRISVVLKPRTEEKPPPEVVEEILAKLEGVRRVEAEATQNGVLAYRIYAEGQKDPREAIFDTAVKENWVLLDLHREQASLEETFRKLTKGEG